MDETIIITLQVPLKPHESSNQLTQLLINPIQMPWFSLCYLTFLSSPPKTSESKKSNTYRGLCSRYPNPTRNRRGSKVGFPVQAAAAVDWGVVCLARSARFRGRKSCEEQRRHHSRSRTEGRRVHALHPKSESSFPSESSSSPLL